jgi:hypothetical protein
MANRYWVGGTASWDSTAGTKWALTSGGAGGQAVPTTADDVFFDAASGAVTCTIATGNAGAKSINCTGFTGTLAGIASISVAGNVTFVSGMTLSYDGTLTITATATIISGGKLVGDTIINAPGGTVTLGGAFTMRASGDFTFQAGTFTTSASNFSLTCLTFSITTAAAKTLTLNSSTVTITQDSNSFDSFQYSGSNLTLNAASATINLSGTDSILNPGTGLTFGAVAFTGTIAGRKQVLGANTFGSFSVTAPASAGSAQVSFSGNQTITTLLAAGASTIRRLMFRSSVFGTARTLTVGTYTTKSNIDFQDITVAGTSSPWSGTSIGDCLGNTNITFTAAKTVYWNLTGSQNWMSAGWAATSGGAPAEANYPLAQDTAVFDNAGAATTVTIQSYSNIGEISASTRTTAMTLTGGGLSQFYKNITNGAGVTMTLAASIELSARSSQTITSAGSTFSGIAARSGANTLVLGDAMNCTGTISLLTGADFNASTYAVTVGTFSATAASTINIGSASWTVTGTGNCWNIGTSTISGTADITLSNNTTTARSFIGGTNTYGKLTIGGDTSTSTTTITGTNTFAEIASTKTVAHTIIFPNITTTVGNWTVRGSAGSLVTLSRTGGSGTFTLAKTGGGVLNLDYLSISNSTATPIDTWYAGANSTNGGGNTNWIFTAAPNTATGNFFNFF